MTYRVGLATLAVIGAVALTACGERSDEQQAIGAVRAWHEALMAGDPEGCSMLMPQARRTLELEADPLGLLSCSEVVGLAAQALTDEERRAMRGIKVRRVEVRGDRATIHNRDVGVPPGIERMPLDGSTDLRKVAGEWKLEPPAPRPS